MTPTTSLTFTAAISMIACCSTAHAPSPVRVAILPPYHTIEHGLNRPDTLSDEDVDFRVQPIITSIQITRNYACTEPTYVTEPVDYARDMGLDALYHHCITNLTATMAGRYELRETTRNQRVHQSAIRGSSQEAFEFVRYSGAIDVLPGHIRHAIQPPYIPTEQQLLHRAYQDILARMERDISAVLTQQEKVVIQIIEAGRDSHEGRE